MKTKLPSIGHKPKDSKLITMNRKTYWGHKQTRSIEKVIGEPCPPSHDHKAMRRLSLSKSEVQPAPQVQKRKHWVGSDDLIKQFRKR